MLVATLNFFDTMLRHNMVGGPSFLSTRSEHCRNPQLAFREAHTIFSSRDSRTQVKSHIFLCTLLSSPYNLVQKLQGRFRILEPKIGIPKGTATQ
jgi:hypothetical protein